MLEDVGYGSIVQDPQRITESPGFQKALSEIGLKEALLSQGIDANKIAEKIKVLMNAVDREGLQDYSAIDKGIKHATAIYGIDTEKPQSNTTYNFILNPSFQQQIKPLEEALKQQFRNVRPIETTEETLDVSKEEQELS